MTYMGNRKGAVLAGGTGTRLRPYTFAINKHLLPVFDRPMVAFPIGTLEGMGLRDVAVVTGTEHLESFRKVLGDGARYGVRLTLIGQDGPKGVAHALLQTESFFAGSKVVAILGDDLFEPIKLRPEVLEDENAHVFVAPATDPQHVAIAELDSSGRIRAIEEHPARPKSDQMVVGLYVFPPDVFEVIRSIVPSARRELEIADVMNWYIRNDRLRSIFTDRFVADAGTEDGFKRATLYAARRSEAGGS
jgi:glucose-1-phosphate thymidylyltransferase